MSESKAPGSQLLHSRHLRVPQNDVEKVNDTRTGLIDRRSAAIVTTMRISHDCTKSTNLEAKAHELSKHNEDTKKSPVRSRSVSGYNKGDVNVRVYGSGAKFRRSRRVRVFHLAERS